MKDKQLMVVEYIYKNKDTFVWLLTDTASLSVRKFLSKLLLSSVRTVYLVPRKNLLYMGGQMQPQLGIRKRFIRILLGVDRCSLSW